MNLSALHYAASVARLGSFSAAARECNVSQPAVSNSIADLEETLGVRLFERTSRRTVPTPAGKRLLPLVLGVLGTLRDLEREAATIKDPGHKLVRVGFSPLVGAHRLWLLMQPLQRQHPDIDVVYKECLSDDMDEWLDANTVDVVCGVGISRAKNRAYQVLVRERLRYLAPGPAPLRRSIDLEQVARDRLVMTSGRCGLAPATRALFARTGLTIDEYPGQAISCYSVLEEFAALGFGGAILPESLIRSAATDHPVVVDTDGPIELIYEAVWRKDLIVASHTKAVVRYLRTITPRSAEEMPACRVLAAV